MNKPSERPSSGAPEKHGVRRTRDWLKWVFIVAFATIGQVSYSYNKKSKNSDKHTDDISHKNQAPEVKRLDDKYKRLFNIYAFLEAKLTASPINHVRKSKYGDTAGIGIEDGKEGDRIIQEMIDELRKIKVFADENLAANRRFNPILFQDFETFAHINIKKRQRTKIMGEFKNALIEAKISVDSLVDSNIVGCSNDPDLEASIKAKFGNDHCDFTNSFLCKALQSLADDIDTPKKLTYGEAIALQRELIRLEFLRRGSDDGKFGKKSIEALEEAGFEEYLDGVINICLDVAPTP